MRNRILHILSVLLVVICLSTLLIGCQTETQEQQYPTCVDQGITRPPHDHDLSVAELDEWVKSKYFTEDGEANAYFWEMAAALYYNNPYKYEYEEVTDYEITFIKNINEGYTVFLVEFEPSGFLYGLRDLSFYSFLHHHPSPFKYLDIAPEDRYYVGDKLAARRGGYIVDIEEEAYVGRVYPVPENYEHKTYVWDYDTTWWIQLDESV